MHPLPATPLRDASQESRVPTALPRRTGSI